MAKNVWLIKMTSMQLEIVNAGQMPVKQDFVKYTQSYSIRLYIKADLFGHSLILARRVARILRGGGGGGGGVWAVNIQTCRESGHMIPRENFRIFGLPWTTFRTFSWWRKRM